MDGERTPSMACPPTFSLLGDCEVNPAPEEGTAVYRACKTLSREARDLYLSDEVEELFAPPRPLQMAQRWIAGNKPLVVRGAVSHWPALGKWTIPYLRKLVGNTPVTVAVTPNGYADAPNAGYFVLPEERSTPFAQFLDVMERPHTQHGVWYVQNQNSSLTEQFAALLPDLEPGGGDEVGWFSQALGRRPDAANFWMGDTRAVTSMHKDPYENIYCVISGYKDFILIPPSDSPWVPYRNYPMASYKFETQEKVEKDEKIDDSKMTPLKDDHSNDSKSESTDHQLLKKDVVKSRQDSCQCGYREESTETSSSGNCLDSESSTLISSIKLGDNHQTGSLEKKPCQSKPNSALAKDRSCAVGASPHSLECPLFSVVPEEPSQTVPWISINPECPDLDKYPAYLRAKPVCVRVRAGDALYLPSLWFHHVSQSHACIAVNYWYDMEFGLKYSYYQMVQALTWKTQETESDEDDS